MTPPCTGSRVLQGYQHASCDAQAAVHQTAVQAAARCAESYGACAVAAPPGWLQQAESSGLRQVRHVKNLTRVQVDRAIRCLIFLRCTFVLLCA
jgi:hypothetical protein